MGRVIRAGAIVYDRERDLPRLIRWSVRESEGHSLEVQRAIVGRLSRALRAERNRARSGGWTYDLNRHIALHQAYQAERLRLTSCEETSNESRL